MATGSPDDYYTLLGIDAKASRAELRRAWRQLALRWHPDRAGPGTTATFQKILAAYTVLANPAARAAYDRRRGAPTRDPGVRSSDASTTPPTASTTPPTASTTPPTASTAPPTASTAPPTASPRRAPGVLLRRLSGSLNTLLTRGVARRAEGDIIELFLNAQEVAEGGMVTISMYVPVRCPACAADAAGSCAHCGTSRTVDELFSAWLAVRPGVAEGTVLTPSALLRGMLRPVSFRVRFGGAA